jgi:hypothetical protein
MSQDKWVCRPTPRRKSLRKVVAERLDVSSPTRRKERAKQWDWLQKQATALFVTYAEPDQ